jgi:hypothetical protein
MRRRELLLTATATIYARRHPCCAWDTHRQRRIKGLTNPQQSYEGKIG